MNSLKFSLVCPSFNHEKFVDAFLQSVLGQTYQNFELIIVDDCSADNTVGRIQSYSDKRITLIQNPFNMGINAGLNTAISRATGDYVVFIASDDTLELNYLEIMAQRISQNPDIGIIYQTLNVINEKGEYQKTVSLKKKYNDKFSILNDMFYKSNRLVSPGMLVEKQLLNSILPLNPAILQYQDYQMHILLLMQSNAYFESMPLVNYRKLDGNKNISAQTDDTYKREMLETEAMMNSFLNIKDVQLMKNIFGEDLADFGEFSDELIPYVLGRLALKSPKAVRRIWGYHTVMNFIAVGQNQSLLNQLYGFKFKDFISLVKGIDFDSSSELRQKYLKYKRNFLAVSIFAIVLLVFSLLAVIF